MSALRFVPVDPSARSGKHLLLRDAEGHKHAGCFRRGIGFTYSCGLPIPAKITHYAARETS